MILVRGGVKTNFLADIVVPTTMDDKVLKAVKADDAGIDNSIWDLRVVCIFSHITYDDHIATKLNILRRFFITRWKKNVRISFGKYLENTYGLEWRTSDLFIQTNSELQKDIKVFKRCMEAVRGATWFEWMSGSTLFFWRWQSPYKEMARDGVPYWMQGRKPTNKRSQPKVEDKMVRERLREKIGKVRKMGYIAPGLVKSLIRYFAVPKGETDIRMVYDGTSSGFNQWVWAPNFGMPTIDSILSLHHG